MQKSPNLSQVALERWYDANQASANFSVGIKPLKVIFDSEYLWITIPVENLVVKMRPSDGLVVGRYPAGKLPLGIAYDGKYIWVTNGGFRETVTKLLGSTGELIGQCEVGPRSTGILFDGKHIWVGGFDQSKETKKVGVLQRVRLSDGKVDQTIETGDHRPGEMVFDGTLLWATIPGNDRVLAVDVKKTKSFKRLRLWARLTLLSTEVICG